MMMDVRNQDDASGNSGASSDADAGLSGRRRFLWTMNDFLKPNKMLELIETIPGIIEKDLATNITDGIENANFDSNQNTPRKKRRKNAPKISIEDEIQIEVSRELWRFGTDSLTYPDMRDGAI